MGGKFATEHGPLSANRFGIQQAIDVGLPDSPDMPVDIPVTFERVKFKHQLKKLAAIALAISIRPRRDTRHLYSM